MLEFQKQHEVEQEDQQHFPSANPDHIFTEKTKMEKSWPKLQKTELMQLYVEKVSKNNKKIPVRRTGEDVVCVCVS